MLSSIRPPARLLLGPLMAVILSGCGFQGAEPAPPAITPGPALPQRAQVASQEAAKGQANENRRTPEAVIPNRVDPKSLSKVVKEEVEGGEATGGPTPSNYLWEPSNVALIKDEPLKVEVPVGLPQLTANVVVPAANPITKGKYELGRQLYFEPRVSLDGTVSCATCHNPATGWTSPDPVAIGINGAVGNRNSPTVINTAYGKFMFWDGRAPSLEAQAQGPIQNTIEMGQQTYKQIIDRLQAISAYREQFQAVFGTPVTLDGMAKAIATFERVAALSGNSPYDKYNAGDLKALNDSEKRGMVLFGLRLSSDDEFKPGVELQKAKCTLCHVGANFSDEQFHNLGIGWDEKGKKFNDLGRWAIDRIGAKYDGDLGAFKTPTVRDIAHTGPYMHDGSLKTLEEVVEHYDKGGIPNPALDKDMKKLNLTGQESKDLVAFMKALTGETKKLEELLPSLPPGPDGKSPDPRAALATPAKKVAAIFHPLDTR